MVAAIGKVTSQARRISPTTFQSERPVHTPMPKIAPVETCVTETGDPISEAPMASPLAMKLAMNP